MVNEVEVKVIFKSLDMKPMFTQFSRIEINSDEIKITEVRFDFFTKEELFKLANTCGVTIQPYGSTLLRLYIHKAFCSVEFMPTKEDKVKYLTEKIDKLSSELNSIINKK